MGRTIIGIDPSLNCTGLCAIDEHGLKIHSTILPSGSTDRLRPFSRPLIALQGLQIFLNEVEKLCKAPKASLVAVEDYAWIRNNRAMYETGELVGLLKFALLDNDYPLLFTMSKKKKKGKVYHNVLMISPTWTIKWLFGSAKDKPQEKDAKAAKVEERWGVRFHTEDEADAYVIALIAKEALLFVDASKNWARELHIEEYDIKGYLKTCHHLDTPQLEIMRNVLDGLIIKGSDVETCFFQGED